MDGFMHPHHDGHPMVEGWPAFPFSGWGMMLIWLFAFLAIVILVYRDANHPGMNGLLRFILVFLILVIREPGAGDAAMDLLRQRYACGEIDEEEFLRERRG